VRRNSLISQGNSDRRVGPPRVRIFASGQKRLSSPSGTSPILEECLLTEKSLAVGRRGWNIAMSEKGENV
jgi:hypothetical protein